MTTQAIDFDELVAEAQARKDFQNELEMDLQAQGIRLNIEAMKKAMPRIVAYGLHRNEILDDLPWKQT